MMTMAEIREGLQLGRELLAAIKELTQELKDARKTSSTT